MDYKSLNWKYDMDEAFRDFFFLSRSLGQWFYAEYSRSRPPILACLPSDFLRLVGSLNL